MIDRGDERRLVANGDTLSAVPLSGDWSRLSGEYWGRALRMARLPAHPTALFVGAGGGTQILLLSRWARPRWLTIVERDPVILQVAQRYFGLGRVHRAEFLCNPLDRVLPSLEAARRRFDFIMEDGIHAEPIDGALPIVLRLAALLAPRGVLVLNRHARDGAAETADALRPHFERVIVRRVRPDRDNALICASHRRPARSSRRRGPRPRYR